MLPCCTTLRFARLGTVLPPRPEGCQVRFEHLAPQQAFALGEQEVATACAAGYSNDTDHRNANDFSEGMKEDVAPRACELGGDMVIITGLCGGEGGSPYGLSLMVLARRGS